MTGKMFLWLLLAIIGIQSTTASPRKPKKESLKKRTMENMMEERGIVPYVIPAGPRDSAMLKYPIINVLRGKAGQVLSHEYCQKRPIITWNGRKDGQYTLAMIITDYHTELDPTTNRTRVTHYNEYIQWLVVNIPGRRYKLGKLVVWYSVPEKPLTKENMYLVFLIYRQPERYNETIVNGMLDPPINNNGSFRIFNFCWKYNMRYPDAGFFYTLRYDVNTTTTVFTTTLKPRKIGKKATKRH